MTKKKKKYNPVKSMKNMARQFFMDKPATTQVHKDKKKYNRKQKHKKRLDDE